MSPVRARYRRAVRDLPRPHDPLQLGLILACCLVVAFVFGPLPGAAALGGYLLANVLLFGGIYLVVAARSRRLR